MVAYRDAENQFFNSDSLWVAGRLVYRYAEPEDYGTNGIGTLSSSDQVSEPESMAYGLPALIGLAVTRGLCITGAATER